MSELPELFKCPFCGCLAFLRNLGVHGFEVGCGTCTASGGGSTKREKAIEQWNARARPQPVCLWCGKQGTIDEMADHVIAICSKSPVRAQLRKAMVDGAVLASHALEEEPKRLESFPALINDFAEKLIKDHIEAGGL